VTSDNTCYHVCEEPGGCRPPPASPLSVAGAASATSSLPYGGGDRWFAFHRGAFQPSCLSHLIPALSRWCGRRSQLGNERQHLLEHQHDIRGKDLALLAQRAL
jgi:hypothetical protein